MGLGPQRLFQPGGDDPCSASFRCESRYQFNMGSRGRSVSRYSPIVAHHHALTERVRLGFARGAQGLTTQAGRSPAEGFSRASRLSSAGETGSSVWRRYRSCANGQCLSSADNAHQSQDNASSSRRALAGWARYACAGGEGRAYSFVSVDGAEPMAISSQLASATATAGRARHQWDNYWRAAAGAFSPSRAGVIRA